MPKNSPAFDLSTVAVVVPVKAFDQAKERLSDLLTPIERITLAKYCADRVIRAASKFDVFVVCDDPIVAQWARDHNAKIVWQPNVGLNAAVHEGVRFVASLNKQLAIVAHSDLPLATDFAHLIEDQDVETLLTSVTLVPDRHKDGTNVMIVPTNVGFEFCYGKNSFSAHQQIAKTCGLSVRIFNDSGLAVDIDTADDLVVAQQLKN